ncbi:MAG: TonB-dependent receptor plug domain-containing protein [Myxococcota bacterium]
MIRPTSLGLLMLLAAPAAARGQYGATGEVERPIPATATEDPTASGTEVPVEHGSGTHASVQELTQEVPGAVPVQTGTYASYAGVSLRGAELDHTSVRLGSLPLGGPDFGGFDLSLVPLVALERIEVYRGGAPVWLSEGAIGGVLQLVPRSEPEPMAGVSLLGGSFGTYGADLYASAGDGGVSSFATAGIRGTRGDYPYRADVLSLDTGDDVERHRRNADSLEGHGLAHLSADAFGGTVEAVGLGVARHDGVPGPAAAPALRARRHSTRSLGMVGWTRREEEGAVPYRVQLAVGGGYQRNQLTDPANEIGLRMGGAAEVTDDRIARVLARAATTLSVAPWLDLSVVGHVQRDAYRPEDHADASTVRDWDRVMPALAVEARLHGRAGPVRLELRPSARLAYSRARVGDGAFANPERRSETEVAPTARVGAVIAPLPWLALSGSVATGKRLPTVLELFGDRNALKPNPHLQPESSLGFDAGAVAEGGDGAVRGAAEVRYFDLRIRDLIAYERDAQYTLTPLNLDEGRIHGVEAGARGWVGGALEVGGVLTWMSTDDGHGRALPGRPTLQAQARPALHAAPWLDGVPWLSDVVLQVGIVHRSAFFPKRSNLEQYPSRTWVSPGLRVELLEGAVSGSVVVHDVLDERGFDWFGYPLPGRRVLATVTYQKEL